MSHQAALGQGKLLSTPTPVSNKWRATVSQDAPTLRCSTRGHMQRAAACPTRTLGPSLDPAPALNTLHRSAFDELHKRRGSRGPKPRQHALGGTEAISETLGATSKNLIDKPWRRSSSLQLGAMLCLGFEFPPIGNAKFSSDMPLTLVMGTSFIVGGGH